MNKRFLLSSILIMLVLINCPAFSQQAKKTIKVGYFEGGTYFLHKVLMGELTEQLERISGDDYEIVFDPLGYRSAEWNRNLCRAMAGDLARMNNLDMVIAFGPWVVEDLLEAGFNKPIIGIYQYDPESAGLVDNTGRPNAANVTVTYDPDKLETDLAALSMLFPNSKCGFLYFPSGQEFKREAQKAAQIGSKYGLDILPAEDYSELGVYSFFKASSHVRKEIDVFYLPPFWGMDLDMLREYLNQVQFDRIATFVSDGYVLLEKGATASKCYRPYRSTARITADKIDKIIRGARPADLPTRFEEIKTLCLNPTVAGKVGVTFTRREITDAVLVPDIPDESIPRYNLSDAIDQALTENASLSAIALTYDRAIAEAGRATSVFFPTVSATAGAVAADNKLDVAQYNEILNRKYFVDINLEQKIFSYPAIKAIHIAQKNKALKSADLKKAQDDLKQAVVTAFLAVLENEERVAADAETVDRLYEFREMAITDSRLGVADSENIPKFEERLLGARLELINARNELQVARVILNSLWQRPADYEFVLNREEFNADVMVQLVRGLDYFTADANIQKRLEEFLVAYAIENSTDMESAELAIGLNRDLIAMNKGRYYPELSLSAKYSYASEFEPELTERKDSWFVGGLLSIPIFLGSDRHREGRILQTRLDELQYKKDALRLILMREVISKAKNVFTHLSTLPINYDARNLSKSILENEAKKYGSDEISYDDLLRFELNLSNRELKLIDDKYSFFISYTEILNKIGAGYLPIGSLEEKAFFEKIAEYVEN